MSTEDKKQLVEENLPDTEQVPDEKLSAKNGEKSEDVPETGENSDGNEGPDTFDRKYVEKLRKESGDYRTRAKAAEERVDGLQRRLHAALVQADGRLADPTDLPFEPEHLEDEDALAAAIGALVERKPGLKARQYGGDVGAGDRATPKKPSTDLIEIIRGMQ